MMACMTAAVLALGMSTMALAAEPAANTITVNGQGIVRVAPDVATIHVTVEKTAKTAAQAQKAVNEELTDVIAAMKALGITDEDIVTSHISVYPSYRYDEKTDKRVLENYQAYTSVNVTTNDVDNAGKEVLRLDSQKVNDDLSRYYEALGYPAVGECIDGAYVGIKREKTLNG